MKVYFYEKPRLRNPSMVAAWPGMGMLAKMSADYLVQQLDAKPFAEIRIPRNDIYFKDGVGELGLDIHRFHYWRGEQGDLIVYSGENQPRSIETIYQLANRVLDVAEEFNVKRIYTFAAVPHPHEVKPRVFGVVNTPELKDFLKEKGVTLAGGEGRITGLNGLLISIAQQRGMEGVCLLCDIRYLDIPQPRSVQTVLGTLTKLLGIEVDLSDLERQAEEIEEKIKRIKERRAPEVVRQKEPKYIS
jgi:hypothetical protein